MSEHRPLLQAFRRYLAGLNDPLVVQFIEGFDWELEARDLALEFVPVVSHLSTIAAEDGGLVATLARHARALHWGRTYTASELGAHFMANYGWVELFGMRGHFACETMAAGFLLLGPQVDYPDHHHIAEEIYIPLTDGALWSKGGAPFAERDAGTVIHHGTGIGHAMRTKERPLVAVYLWRGGPLVEKPKFEGDRS